jgi:hypothetical protein
MLVEHPSPIPQRLVELLFPWHVAREIELPPDASAPLEQRHGMAPLGRRCCAGEAGWTGTHDGNPFPDRWLRLIELDLAPGLRIDKAARDPP